MDGPNIEAIELRLTNDLTAKLTVQQARTLLEQLRKLFGEEKPAVIYRDNYTPYRPWFGTVIHECNKPYSNPTPQRHRYGEIWCKGNESGSATAVLEANWQAPA